MSNCKIDLYFADGVYDFFLPLPRIDELQRKLGRDGKDCPIGDIFQRLGQGVFHVPNGAGMLFDASRVGFNVFDVIEPIRQGLIGGGRGVVDGTEIEVTPSLANKLIENYVMTRPLIEAWKIAYAVVGACIAGYTPPKKDPPADKRAPMAKKREKAGSTTA